MCPKGIIEKLSKLCSKLQLDMPGLEDKTTPEKKDVEQASEVQDIRNERDLYEKKSKALSVVMASKEKENSDLKKEISSLKRHVESIKMASTTMILGMISILEVFEKCVRPGEEEEFRRLVNEVRAKLLKAIPESALPAGQLARSD